MIIFELIWLVAALVLTLFLPGYFLLRALVAARQTVALTVESLVLSVGLSVFVVDFLFIGLHLLGIPITQLSAILAVGLFCLAALGVSYHRNKKITTDAGQQPSWLLRLSLSKAETGALVALFLLAVLIRFFFIAQGSIPQTTDLGHHMYWAKSIVTEQKLPDYGMPDFIIGEHIIFGIVGAISQIDFVSAMPVVTLMVINIVSLLAMFLLAYRLAEMIISPESALKVGLLSLVTIGIFYAISSPQAKFVSGGVIGNVMGNFLMPLTLYCFLSAVRMTNRSAKKSVNMSARFYYLLMFMLLATLAYTHHLTTFVLLFALVGFIFGMIIMLLGLSRLNFRQLWSMLAPYLEPMFNARSVVFIAVFMVLALLLYPPSYLNTSAIDTAVGTPVKETRTGIGFNELALTTGPWRFFYAGITILLLKGVMAVMLLNKYRPEHITSNTTHWTEDMGKIIASLLVIGWFGMLLVMSNQPDWLKVDIPTARVANYLTIPASLLSAIGVYYLFQLSQKRLSSTIAGLLVITIMGTGFVSGLTDVSDSARQQVDVQAARQTYQASEYLAKHSAADEIILKDHVYLSADSWIKLFLMRDYKNPLSRALLRRYEDIAKDRETCTRDMVAIPNSDIGQQCFEETGTKYVMLKPGYDTEQFEKSDNFSKIFSGPDVVIYKRQ